MDDDKVVKTLELAVSIMNSRDVNSVLRMIVDNVTDNFVFEACDAFILDEERDNFVLRASKGFSNDRDGRFTAHRVDAMPRLLPPPVGSKAPSSDR